MILGVALGEKVCVSVIDGVIVGLIVGVIVQVWLGVKVPQALLLSTSGTIKLTRLAWLLYCVANQSALRARLETRISSSKPLNSPPTGPAN